MESRFIVSRLSTQQINNISYVDKFVLLGLVSSPTLEKVLFVAFSVIYTMTIFGNLTVILIIRLDSDLHKPMYFFLANLAFLEIFYTTATTPNTLKNLLQKNRTISFVGCFTQMFFFIGLGSAVCVLLSVMAYDRYVAICQPLVYSAVMIPSFCIRLTVVSWSCGFFNAFVQTIYTSTLPFCKDHVIHHFFCDIPSLVKLSCSDADFNELVSILVRGCIIIGSFVLTLISYIFILRTVLRIPTMNGRKKVFSTCGSHLIVVTLFFGTGIITYMLPGSSSFSDHNRVLSVVYGVLTPFINPLIYSFRNTDFQHATTKIIQLR
ncbi:olfactory receptor 5F1-like [Lithobates pipiens]